MSYGLVLEGGGGRGAFHIGVWRALREMNIEIGAVTGTSIGAMNGALIVLDEFEAACKLWEEVQTKDIIDVDPKLLNEVLSRKTKLNGIEAYFSLFKYIFENKGFNITPLKQLILRYMDEERLRNSEIDFGFVTVSITDRKALEIYLEDVPEGKVHDYLLASAYLPVFQVEDLDGKRFVDGAFFDNLPIRLLTKKGHKKIIAVHLNSIGFKQKVVEENVEIIHIYPSGDLGATLFFHPLQSRQNMLMGYLDTLKAFGQVHGNSYYIENVPTEDEIFQILLHLPSTAICKLASLCDEKLGDERRFLFEFLLPQLARFLNVPLQAGYQFLYLTLLEYGAEIIGLNRFKQYDYQYFLTLVLPKFCAYERREILETETDKSMRSKDRKGTVLYYWLLIFLELHQEELD